MLDRFHGAWLGHSIGCSLGLPLEVDPFTGGLPGKPGWKCVQHWFAGADAWPITGYTPRESRLAADVRQAVAESSQTQLELVERIEKAFNRYFWVHTDCNAATVGSIMGAMVGASAIPEHWKAPLGDSLCSGIPGFHSIAISTCGARSHALWKRLGRG